MYVEEHNSFFKKIRVAWQSQNKFEATFSSTQNIKIQRKHFPIKVVSFRDIYPDNF